MILTINFVWLILLGVFVFYNGCKLVSYHSKRPISSHMKVLNLRWINYCLLTHLVEIRGTSRLYMKLFADL